MSDIIQPKYELQNSEPNTNEDSKYINKSTTELVNILYDTKNNKTLEEYKKIYVLMQTYLFNRYPIFNESFNKGYPTDNTYIIKISYNIIQKVINLLHFLKYKDESYLSRDDDDTSICGLQNRSYAFFKSKINVNGEIIYVFCMKNNKNCKGILLSPHIN